MRWHSGRWAAAAAVMLLLGLGVADAATTPSAAPEASAAKDAWLGVYTQTLTPELREGLNYTGTGALVSRIVAAYDRKSAKAGRARP